MNYRDLYVCIYQDGLAKSKSIIKAWVFTLHSLQGRLLYLHGSRFLFMIFRF